MAREQIAQLRVLNIDFYPRESHLVTFRDPWSFPTLFHPACNHLVRMHMDELAQKVLFRLHDSRNEVMKFTDCFLEIVSVCVSLGEYPTIRYYSPRSPRHDASVLCSHLARFVQLELDQYAKFHEEFPPPSPRPRGALIVTDRSMDLFAPLVHEFTYQAMVHDLLPLEEGDKVYYKTTPDQKEGVMDLKNIEIGEKDNIWVKNRHLHMKDLLEKLASDFQAFKAKNPQFSERLVPM